MKTMIAKALAGGALALATCGGIAGAVDDYCGTPYPGWPIPPGPYARIHVRFEPNPDPWRAVGSAVVVPVEAVGLALPPGGHTVTPGVR